MESKTLLTNKNSMRFFSFLIIFITTTICGFGVHAVNSGDYRSILPGNWTAPTTWEQFDGTNWQPTPLYPGQAPSNNAVTIQAGHVIQMMYDEVVNNMGTVTIDGVLHLAGTHGGGTFYLKTDKIMVNSTGTINFDLKGTLSLLANTALVINSGGNITGTCTNNNLISIGGSNYAVCSGGGAYLLFSDVVAGGGSLSAIPASNSPVSSCSSIELTGNYSGAIGTPVTYSWSVKDPNNAVTPYTTKDVTIPNAILGNYEATLTVSTVYGSTTYINSVTIPVTVNPPGTETWTGAVSTNWNENGNWSCGVPTANTDVIIPATTNKPTIGAGVMADCKTLTINTGAVVTIAPDGYLNVVESITNNAGVEGIEIQSSATLPSGTLIFHNPFQNPVPATVEFYSKASITGDPKQYHYQFFGIPFQSMEPLGNLDESFIFRHNETKVQMWDAITVDSVMYPMLGYAITQEAPLLYSMSGNLYNLPFMMPLTYSFMNTETNDYKRGEHIIANPYTAAIPISDMQFFGTDATVYLYNTGSYDEWSALQNTSGNAPGQYLSVPQELAGEDGLPASIPSMQGFMVKVLPPTHIPTIKAYNSGMQSANKIIAAGGLLTIPYPSVSKNANTLRAKKAETEKVFTAIEINGQRFGDKLWLFTEPKCTRGFDNGYDGRKIMGSELTPQFYSVEEDENYQVNSLKDINNTLLGFKPGIDTEYTLTFKHFNTANAYPDGIYLIDMVADKVVDVTENGAKYSFTAVRSSNVNGMKSPSSALETPRFKIVTSPQEPNGIKNTLSLINVFVTGKNLVIDNKTSAQGELTVFDTTGRNLMNKKVSNGLTSINVDFPAGAYITQVTTKDSTYKTTIIIK